MSRPVPKAELNRLIQPVSRQVRIAAGLSVLAGLLWPVQAALIATVIAGWVAGDGSLPKTSLMVLGILGAGLVRAAIDHQAGGILFRAADRVIGQEKAALIAQAGGDAAASGSAAYAALVVQKLPMLHPWLTRYYPARARTAAIPAILALIALPIAWPVTLIFILAGPLIPIFMALIGMAAEDASRRHLREIGSLNTMLMDRLAALLDIRVLGARRRAVAAFDTQAHRLHRQTMAVLKIAFLSSTVLELFAAIGVAMVAVYVGFSLLGELDFGTWRTPLTLWQGLFVLLLAPEFFQPLRDLAAAWHDRAASIGVAEDLHAARQASAKSYLGQAEKLPPLPGALSLSIQDATVPYGDQRIALPNLTLRAGESLALTGPSGCGKSTALRALAGLLPIDTGRIAVCGVDLNDAHADAWRARLSFVAQIIHFPNTTLARYLDPDDQGLDLPAALGFAHAAEIVARLPNGLFTRLGESGGGVSGGEARRLTLARAIAQDADLVIADEPTADLDRDTARLVIDTLVALNGQGKTVLVATHDPDLASAMQRRIDLTTLQTGAAR